MIGKFIKLIIGLAILLALAGMFWFNYQINRSADNSSAVVNFAITKGEGVNAISRNLYQAGLIRNKFVFETYVWLVNKENRFIAGEHNVYKNINIKELTKLLTTETVFKERTITIIEGWNLEQIGGYFENEGLSEIKDFNEAVFNINPEFRNDYAFLKNLPANASLEGYLFPDTYRIYTDSPLDDVIRKMLDNFDNKLSADLKAEINKQGKNLEDIIILASIVEKEAAKELDRRMIADIFYKRLDANIGLQSDATVNYITGKNMLQPTIDDTKLDNLYNTYKYRGLPPGPICNPGLSSIQAVIYPQANDYYYFLTTPDGTAVYAKTYQEHLRNKQKYLK